MRCLLAARDVGLLRRLGAGLARRGYDVRGVESSGAAQRALCGERFDVVLAAIGRETRTDAREVLRLAGRLQPEASAMLMEVRERGGRPCLCEPTLEVLSGPVDLAALLDALSDAVREGEDLEEDQRFI